MSAVGRRERQLAEALARGVQPHEFAIGCCPYGAAHPIHEQADGDQP